MTPNRLSRTPTSKQASRKGEENLAAASCIVEDVLAKAQTEGGSMLLALASAVAIYVVSCALPFIARTLDDLRIRLNLAVIDIAMTITAWAIVINLFGWIGFIAVATINAVLAEVWQRVLGVRPHEMYRLKEKEKK